MLEEQEFHFSDHHGGGGVLKSFHGVPRAGDVIEGLYDERVIEYVVERVLWRVEEGGNTLVPHLTVAKYEPAEPALTGTAK